VILRRGSGLSQKDGSKSDAHPSMRIPLSLAKSDASLLTLAKALDFEKP